MDAKARKVLNGLTKLGGEQEVFDLSIAIKMTEDAVQAYLSSLSEEGLVSCRRDGGGKEFWSLAEAKAAPADAGEPAPGKKKAKATALGPDDRFDEFVVDPKAAPAPPAPSPPPLPPEPAEIGSFEPAPPAAAAPPADDSPAAEADFESKPPAEEKRAKSGADFEPEPEKPAKRRAAGPDGGASEPKPAKESRSERELSAGPDDHFDEFAERVPSKHSLPLPLMAGAAVLVLLVVLFIVGGGGKSKKIREEIMTAVKTEVEGKIDSLAKATAADIEKVRAENKALRGEINALKKAIGQEKKAAADKSAKQPAKKR